MTGGDDGVWGRILNTFLLAEHRGDGSLRIRTDGTLDKFYVKPQPGIARADLDPVVQASLDLADAAVAKNSLVVNVKDFGAKGDGVTDDTTAIQAAIASGGVTFLPVGTYQVSGLVLSSKTVLMGVGSGSYGGSPGGNVTCIRLIPGSNKPVISVPAGMAAGRILDLEIDGTKNYQTAGLPAGILFESAPSSEESQWRLERCYIHDTRGSGIEIQSNRQANRVRDCAIYACGYYGIDCSASDQILTGNLIGLCYLDGVLVNEKVVHVFAGDIFGNRSGINITPAGRGTMITNTGIDRNNQAGIYSSGSSVSIVSCSFHTNSQASFGGWPTIQITDQYGAVDSIAVVGCTFWHDPGYANKPDYHVRLDNTAAAQVVSCSMQGGSSSSGLINAPSRSGPLISKPVVSGSKAGNDALTSLVSALAEMGLLTDATT